MISAAVAEWWRRRSKRRLGILEAPSTLSKRARAARVMRTPPWLRASSGPLARSTQAIERPAAQRVVEGRASRYCSARPEAGG
jgi:hypothetical protein